MRPWFADSVFYFALLSERDEYHDRAVDLNDQARRMVTTQWVLMEVADGLAGVGQRAHCVNLFDALSRAKALAIIPASDSMFRLGLDLYRQRPDKEWSLTDCISFVAMRERNLREALTGDHHFEQAGFVAMLK